MEYILEEVGDTLLVLLAGSATAALFIWVLGQATAF